MEAAWFFPSATVRPATVIIFSPSHPSPLWLPKSSSLDQLLAQVFRLPDDRQARFPVHATSVCALSLSNASSQRRSRPRPEGLTFPQSAVRFFGRKKSYTLIAHN
jgi:hypothetical protein